jgi:hypothetical protein
MNRIGRVGTLCLCAIRTDMSARGKSFVAAEMLGWSLHDPGCAKTLMLFCKIEFFEIANSKILRHSLWLRTPAIADAAKWLVNRLSDTLLIRSMPRFACMQPQATPVSRLPERAAMSLVVAPYVDRAGLKFGSDQVYTGLSTDCFDSSKLTLSRRRLCIAE